MESFVGWSYLLLHALW